MRFKDIVEIEFQQDYYKQLHQFVENEYLHKTIFPPKENIFRELLQDLPQGFNFTSTYTCSAQTARAFYFARKNHKQKELRDLAKFFSSLPEIGEFITAGEENEK